MRFLVRLQTKDRIIPINYQYPMSAAIYKIISQGDAEYAEFLHNTGYGKGFKFFTFSQLNCKFEIDGDRMNLLTDEVSFQIAFHLPQAMENFVKGLFQSQKIEIADKKSRAVFSVKSVESLPNPLQKVKENEIIKMELEPLSPIVAAVKNENGNYTFLSPEDARFAESLLFNWRSKIAACYDDETAQNAMLLLKPILLQKPPKSRLITIKEGTAQQTKIRGWMNLKIEVTAERKFVEMLMNAGAGPYNSLGCGILSAKEIPN
ncbi:CRISPR-associated protein, Cas6 family [Cruoricaptor ignavus]|uniref:CRISPR-associated endoribonuclease n=1 Tax=Cruoricaptor ignavus TaxID=1118202 RepID=A0A1M6DLF7_9FLAO|nr:CRISPR-associated endoribonuclease Cas6 [Cruoricaptor ignavus]SHI73899.1 CRISPR-associated protein, Cas6 family [Cruoricaptor ignavus]